MEDEKVPEEKRKKLLSAAREIIGLQQYCALVTIDETGRPQARAMNPFPPDDNFCVWMATNSRSRKVKEIERNPRVLLYYADHATAMGCVTISGTARLVDEFAEKKKRFRDYWKTSFPDWRYLLLIKVVPETIDVLNYKQELLNAEETWRVPSLKVE